jgi:hypothetical protein
MREEVCEAGGVMVLGMSGPWGRPRGPTIFLVVPGSAAFGEVPGPPRSVVVLLLHPPPPPHGPMTKTQPSMQPS